MRGGLLLLSGFLQWQLGYIVVVRYIADQIHTHPCILRSMEMEMQLASMAMAWWPARLASSLLRTMEMEKIRTHRTRQIIY